MPTAFQIRTLGYDHPDAQRLIAEVQAEYVVRYGGPDESPVDPAEFADPLGTFVVLYVRPSQLPGADVPLAMGGWRRRGDTASGAARSAAAGEIKRMYVNPAGRGRGYARAILSHLERTAVYAGLTRLELETGRAQPEAIALYQSCGYRPIPAFGHYADAAASVHLGKTLTPTG